jgi:hypothetical protein
MFTLKHEKHYLLKNLLYTCVRKDWNVIQLRRHWQLLETEVGAPLLTNPDVFGTLVGLKSKSYRVKTLL